MKEGIYEFYKEFGRMGELAGLFFANDTDIKDLTEKDIEVYFGEVLGKHSEVFCNIDPEDIELRTEDSDFIEAFKKIFGTEYNSISGINPFAYLEEDWRNDIEK